MVGLAAKAEFSRPIAVDRVEDGLHLKIEADAAERAALAQRFDLLALDKLAAEVSVRWESRGKVLAVSIDWQAAVVQRCVVSLDPVPALLRDVATLRFSEAEARADEPEVEFGLDSEDPPEPLTGPSLDVGELTAEQMALALDPYPRRPGAEIPAIAQSGGGVAQHPFAALAKLREKK